mgnify:CR=1 FL=1
MKAVVFTPDYWHRKLFPRLIEEHGKAIRISYVCKQRLGFTVREHRAPISDDGHIWDYQHEIHLDFYDEQMRTWFILRYKNNDES